MVVVLGCLGVVLLVLEALDVLWVLLRAKIVLWALIGALDGQSLSFFGGFGRGWDSVVLESCLVFDGFLGLTRSWGLSIHYILAVDVVKGFLRHGLLLVCSLECSRRYCDVVVSMMESYWCVRLVTFVCHSCQVRGVLGLVASQMFFISILHYNVLIECYLVSC